MTPDWIVKVVADRGPGHFYRYHVRGVNLSDSGREFGWDVPTIDDPRFDLTNALHHGPVTRLYDLPAGERFSIIGYPESVYISRGNGWYDTEAGYAGGPWHNSTQLVVKL